MAADVLVSVEAGKKKGRPPTIAQLAILRSAPRMDDGLAAMTRAYVQLSTCRAIGMGIGPIPWDRMLEWARHHGLDHDATEHLIEVLMLVDAETLRRANKAK